MSIRPLHFPVSNVELVAGWSQTVRMCIDEMLFGRERIGVNSIE